jgi:hypothetical protein
MLVTSPRGPAARVPWLEPPRAALGAHRSLSQ